MTDNVTVETVARLPTLPDSLVDVEAAAPHTAFQFQSLYFRNNGKMQIPVGGPPGTPSVFVDLCAPWGKRIVVWLASRDNAIPELPDPETGDPNEVLEDVAIGTLEPKVIDGLHYGWHITGKYVYGLLEPPDKSTGYKMGSSPLSAIPNSKNVVKARHFTQHTQGYAQQAPTGPVAPPTAPDNIVPG